MRSHRRQETRSTGRGISDRRRFCIGTRGRACALGSAEQHPNVSSGRRSPGATGGVGVACVGLASCAEFTARAWFFGRNRHSAQRRFAIPHENKRELRVEPDLLQAVKNFVLSDRGKTSSGKYTKRTPQRYRNELGVSDVNKAWRSERRSL